MPSPFPGMDPFLETIPIFQELHTQMLAEIQAMLQPQLRPKYVARLERHLSEGSVWDGPHCAISLERKEPDVTILRSDRGGRRSELCRCTAPPPLRKSDAAWVGELLRARGLRRSRPRGGQKK
jgi:hypothetical protein